MQLQITKLPKALFNLAKRATKADIVKVFSLTSISTLVRMLTGLISVKVVATIIGPAGIALVGQLNNFVSMSYSFASGGINSGITKYVAEYKNDESQIKKYLSSAWRITLIFTLSLSIILIVLHRYISELIMLSSDYGYVFLILGFTILCYSVNGIITSVVNGYKEFKQYVKISIANTIFGLIFSLALVIPFGLEGALIGAVTYQSVALFVTLYMTRKLPWRKLEFFNGKWDKAIVKQYLGYTLMALTTASIGPVSQMLLRGYVIAEISPVNAGWWEGMNRISGMYLSVITTSFSVYYLPRLSEISNPLALRKEILKCYAVIVPMLLVATLIIYLLRFFIIRLLFTPAFLPMSDLFIWQMFGDFFKIVSWLLSFIMVAKSMTKAFISTEIIFGLLFVALGFIFMRLSGVVGLCQAYLANYILYLITMLVIFRHILFLKPIAK